MRRGRRGGWWYVVPMFAVMLVPRRASGQMCGTAIDATVTIVDMAESGGVGVRVRTIEEAALDRLTRHTGTGGGWPADTSIWVNRVAVRIETLPPPRDSLPRRVRITVVHPD
jgi:hypothetical protein